MWFWNRAEVYLGWSLEEFSKMKSLLVDNYIKYDYKVVDNSSYGVSNRRASGMGTFGENSKFRVQYYLYVYKKDYERAQYILSRK
jgi:hypothetical protein